jgi:AcrR family transcriptional regulator
MFFEDGYYPTSLEKVADAAGYSKGAVYSNFRNKDELCTTVLDEVRAQRIGEVVEMMAQADTPARIEALRDWAERVIGDPGWTTLEVEFAVHARRNAELRSELAGRVDAILQMLATAAESAENADLKMPGRETATAMLALGIGLGLLRSIDPAIPVNGLIDTLRLVSGQPL